MTFEQAQREIARLTIEAGKYNAAADRAQVLADNGGDLFCMQRAMHDVRHYRRTARRFIARADAIVDSVECAA